MAAPKDLSALDYLLKKGDQNLESLPEATGQESGSSIDRLSRGNVATNVLHGLVASQLLTTCASLEREPGAEADGVLLSEIDRRLLVGAEMLAPVVRLLARTGLLEVVEQRPFDDHRVRLTEEGRSLVAPGKQFELLERLGLESQ